ncbi:MFS transporter [Streptomyces sp. NEAU-sy36]|uniref:MFS transporter n=1 Tax=unclassified Streptomyces TaxID=2593676 RepID=UPI0015D5E8FC|nr:MULTISPECIES: MFS transporter [unclassified Streptomyces]QLJ03412.1 MFS transporter [Streptomyces sp. NEAU-sy36]
MLTTTNFLVVFDGLVVTVALPALQHSLGLGRVGMQWVMAAYTLPLGGMLLLGGRCGDRYGRRPVLITGFALFITGLLLAGLAPALWLLLPGRMLQGAGAALAVPTSFAIISAKPSPVERNRLFAAVAVAGGVGAAGGAVIGGVVTQGLGWRYVFLLSVPVALLAALLTPKVLDREPPASKIGGLDLPGVALSMAGLMMLVFAITNTETAGTVSFSTFGSLALSAVAFAGFILQQRRTADPLLHLGILRVPSFRTAVLAMPANEFAYQGSVFIGLLFFQQALGYSPLVAGLAFSPLGLVVLIGSSVANRLLRRYRWTVVASCAQFVSAVGLVLLALAGPGSAYMPHILPSMLILGLGTVVGAVSFNVAAGKDISPDDKGVGYGVFETAKYVAGVFAVAGLGSIAAARTSSAGATGHTAALTSGYQLAFAVAALTAVIGGVLVAVLGDAPGTGAGQSARSAGATDTCDTSASAHPPDHVNRGKQ